MAVQATPRALVLGDADGDLDLLTANAAANTVSVRLNRGIALATAPASPVTGALRLHPNPARRSTTVTGLGAGKVARIFDALGRQIGSATADATGTATLLLPVGLASGVYVVRAETQAVHLTVE